MRTRVPIVSRAHPRAGAPSAGRRSIIATLYAGLTMTVVAALVPYLDRARSNTLADHIRAGYPTYSRARIDTAANTYLVLLSLVGILGAAGWLGTIHAVTAGRRWARAGATVLFAFGAGLALTGLLATDTSGATGLPHWLGWVGLLPCFPGLLAVVLLWRRSARRIEFADRTNAAKSDSL